MDEYDTPINNVLQTEEFSKNDLLNTLVLFRKMMGKTFKGNDYLEKGLITGILSKSSLFSDLNNIKEFNFLNNPFATYYGFTETDINHLFAAYKINAELVDTAKSWYDGYRVLDPKLTLYNPWSIVKNYWEESGSIDFIKDLFKIDDIKTKVQSLLSQGVIKVHLENLKFSMDNFLTLKELLNVGDNYKIEQTTID